MAIPFVKYQGCGNDFILVDERNHPIPDLAAWARLVCHRQRGIGADGLIALQKGARVPYKMRIFNADGSEAEMCGNGLRCLAHYIHSAETPEKLFPIETMHATLDVAIRERSIATFLPPASNVHSFSLPIEIPGSGATTLALHALNTGVPHAVAFVADLELPHLMAIAPTIRSHPSFGPAGTNVNYAAIRPDGSIAVRTYERGVEQETLACGTGAAAVALAASKLYAIQPPITICTRSGDCLTANWESPAGRITLEGPVVRVFEGSIAIRLHS